MAKGKKIPQNKHRGNKTIISNPVSSDQDRPVWSFANIDKSGKFAFDTTRKEFNHQDFVEKMIDYSGLTWQEIKQQTHDKKGKSKHHTLSYGSLSKEAQGRLIAKNLSEYEDSLFSFALNNLTRIIGIRKREKFDVIWYDPYHEFCPSHKKHT